MTTRALPSRVGPAGRFGLACRVMPVLGQHDDLPPEVYGVARRVSRSFTRSPGGLHPSFDVDDLEQVCRLAAWKLLQEVEPTEAHPYGFSLGVLGNILKWRAIDWMRSVNPVGTPEAPRLTPVSLQALADRFSEGGDTPRQWAAVQTFDVEDHGAEVPFIDVENHDAIQRAIDLYPGPPWHSELALLVAHGLPLSEAGAAYGFTESRACQVVRLWGRGVRGQLDGESREALAEAA